MEIMDELYLQNADCKVCRIGPVADADTGHRDAAGHLGDGKKCIKPAKSACCDWNTYNRFVCHGCDNARECRREPCYRDEDLCVRAFYIGCELLRIAGGKERMRRFFDERGWPADPGDREAFLKDLHRQKTDIYLELIESGSMPLRPGVARLVDEAFGAGVPLAVCSTSNERAVNGIVERLLGPERKARFAAILAGDIVSRKKPDPEIYRLASERLDVRPARCVVVEDSRNGLLAAKAAGMRCVVTTNGYTEGEDFTGADLVVPELGDPPRVRVTLRDLEFIAEDDG